MANRRMFSLKVVDTDAFLDMPLSSQALYFHLSMRADDDGFVSNPKKIMRMIGTQDDDLRVLITKRFILPFESGICVIKHWRVHNYIQNDRHQRTQWVKELGLLCTDPETGKYRLVDENTEDKDKCIQNVSKVDTQVRTGEVRTGQERNTTSPAGDAHGYTDDFEAFWSVYPKKVGKGAAFKAWRKIKPGKQLQERILGAVQQQSQSEQWQKENGKYIPNPATWLNQARWDDELGSNKPSKYAKYDR